MLSLVAGVRLLSLRFRGLVLGSFTSKKAWFALLTTAFLFPSTYKNKFLTCPKTKSPALRARLFPL
jgi:hypothetical protein